MREVIVAALQMRCVEDRNTNLNHAEIQVREAAEKGAQIILIQEVFETLYFCQIQDPKYFKLATTMDENPAVNRFKNIAKELDVVIIVPFFEKAGNVYFNAAAIVDADGSVMGNYRKSHIPYGARYMEKYYFTPGDTGFKVWNTKYANIGVGICWDQWFPESGRLMALKGAELLFYPTANGTDPLFNDPNGVAHWRNCMRGQAVSNSMPIIASNRVGVERIGDGTINFFGHSFIMDESGELLEEADDQSELVITHTFDLDALQENRNAWSLFRDRRPELYKKMLTKDGDHTCVRFVD